MGVDGALHRGRGCVFAECVGPTPVNYAKVLCQIRYVEEVSRSRRFGTCSLKVAVRAHSTLQPLVEACMCGTWPFEKRKAGLWTAIIQLQHQRVS